MPSTDLHVVLGASGGIGGALVRELAGGGHRIRAVNRRGDADVPAGAERLAADVSTPDGARAAAAGAAVVYHAAQPAYHRWPEEFAAMNDAVIDGAGAAGAKLVFADNLYMYGPLSGPITEDTPERNRTRKGAVRVELSRRLRAAHEAGRVRTTMGRAADYYGPGGLDSGAGETMFGAALRGRAVRWAGSADVAHTFSYLGDVAAGLVTLGTRDEADGRAWVLPTAGTITAREFVGLIGEELGRQVKLRTVGRSAMRLAGLFIPPARELPDIWYQFTEPFTVDASAFARTFGAPSATPYREGIAATLAWFRGHLAVSGKAA